MSMAKRLLVFFGLGLLITSCAQVEVRSTGPNRLAELTKPLQNLIPKEKPKSPKPKVNSIYPVDAKPVYVGNKVYFYTNCGSMVQSVTPGQVIYSGKTLKAYNYIVLIKTPQNLVDVYTYLGKAFVAKGDYVKKGAIIGEVGVDPIDNVCKLLYETRNTNGDIVNPVF